MNDNKPDELILSKVICLLGQITSYGNGVRSKSDLEDPKTAASILWCLMKLGKLTSQFSSNFIENNPNVPWSFFKSFDGFSLVPELTWYYLKNKECGALSFKKEIIAIANNFDSNSIISLSETKTMTQLMKWAKSDGKPMVATWISAVNKKEKGNLVGFPIRIDRVIASLKEIDRLNLEAYEHEEINELPEPIFTDFDNNEKRSFSVLNLKMALEFEAKKIIRAVKSKEPIVDKSGRLDTNYKYPTKSTKSTWTVKSK